VSSVSTSSRSAAIVVDYFAGDVLANCIASLQREHLAAIVVVDNSTESASVATLGDADVTVVETMHNLGYGRAMNRGVAIAPPSEFLLLSNPDIEVHAGAVAALEHHLDSDPEVALVGPTILDSEGSTYPSIRVFPNVLMAGLHALCAPWWPSNPFTRRYRQPRRDGRIDWVSGAFVLVRREAFQQVGGFDERYFMFAEDMDLCWRLQRAGYAIGHESRAVITHIEGVSRRRAPRMMVRAHHLSAMRFEWRTATGWRRALAPLAIAVLGVRYVLVSSLSRRRS
jgi:N-acetylglucosaminyl-diphospho-decaprenol L-rhamnosyltransferase